MLLVTFHLTKEYTSHLIAGYFPTTKQHDILPRYGLLSHCEEVHKPPRCELLTHYKIACYPTALRVTFPLPRNTRTTTLRVTYPLQNSMLSYRVVGYLPTTKEHANQRNTDYNHTPPEKHTPPRCGLPPPSHHDTQPRCGLPSHY